MQIGRRVEWANRMADMCADALRKNSKRKVNAKQIKDSLFTVLICSSIANARDPDVVYIQDDDVFVVWQRHNISTSVRIDHKGEIELAYDVD